MMKTKTCIFAILLTAGLSNSHAQDTWTQKADFGGVGRAGATGFTIGSKGYIGLGEEYPIGYKDFWEYDPDANTWTQKADFGGRGRLYAVGFTIAGKGYVGTGQSGAFPNYTYYKDFWEYDPSLNTWTRRSDFGGTARYGAAGFSIDSKGYLGTGVDASLIDKKDFWEFDPIQNIWTQKADFGGVERKWGTGFSIGVKGYVGLGGHDVSYKDFWEYDPATDIWMQKADFGGSARVVPVGFSIGNKGYIGTGENENTTTLKDFWQFDPTTNTWSQKADFGGTGRNQAAGFSIGSKGYIGTGVNPSGVKKDFWEYTPGESSAGCLPPPAGLVSWWSGDRTAEDVQGTNPGRLLNGASFRPGKVGPGFVFDGVDDWVRIPNSASLSQTRITVDAWVYPTGKQGTNRHIVSKDNDQQTREYILAATFYDTFTANVWLANNVFVEALGTTPIQLNTWYHVAMTHDGTKLRLYLNGVLEAISDAVGDIVPTVNPVGIGGNSAPVFFQGIIDEGQIFNRALSDAEILAIYQAGAAGQCKPEIFVSSIDPSYEVRGRGFLISTSIVIQDENGVGIEDALVQIKTTLPSGSVLDFPATTDATGQAIVSFATQDSGLYKFKVRKVTHPTREYDPSLNVETTDTLLIP